MEAKDLKDLMGDAKNMADVAKSMSQKLSSMVASLPENDEQRKLVKTQLADISKILNKLPSEIANAVNNRG